MRTLFITLLILILIGACVDTVPTDTNDDTLEPGSNDHETGEDESAGDAPAQDDPESDPEPRENAPTDENPTDDQPSDEPSEAPKDAFRGDYYHGRSFDTYVDSRTHDEISFDYGYDAPLDGMDVDDFSIRWSGRFDFEDADYTFTASADDGIRVYVDDERIIDEWRNQSVSEYTRTYAMSGEHTITVEYYEAHAPASVSLSWTRVDDERENPTAPPSPAPSPDPCDDCRAHELLLEELVGFGQGETIGGKGGDVYTVTSLADSGPETLRDALTRSEPLWIRFAVSGTIDLDSPIESGSYKTIDGRGADVTISDHGIYITGEEHVIINNMKFYRPSDDAIRIYNGARNVWVHHNDITADWEYPDAAVGDGAIDSTEDTTAITVSYNHIYDWDKTMLVGAGGDSGDGYDMRWTAHHNWYDNVRQRLPMVRHGWAHSYNNLFNWYGGYALDAHYQPAEIYSENDIFEPLSGVDHKVVAIASGTSVRIDGAYEKPYSTSLTLSEQNPSDVFDPSAYYSYAADPADASLESYIESNAGWQDVTWP